MTPRVMNCGSIRCLITSTAPPPHAAPPPLHTARLTIGAAARPEQICTSPVLWCLPQNIMMVFDSTIIIVMCHYPLTAPGDFPASEAGQWRCRQSAGTCEPAAGGRTRQSRAAARSRGGSRQSRSEARPRNMSPAPASSSPVIPVSLSLSSSLSVTPACPPC